MTTARTGSRPAGIHPTTPRPLVGLTDRERAVAYQAAALLLGYPDEELMAALPVVTRAVRGLPGAVGGPLLRLAGHLAAGAMPGLTADYVATFDLDRRRSLYLTYYTYGDTRKRGMALLACKGAYCAAGLEPTADELADHLAVMLEFAATGDAAAGAVLLAEHRIGLELLRLALADAGSPYVDAVEAVCLTLPALPGRDRDTVLALARQGPPAEDVGLDPYRDAFAPPAEYLGGFPTPMPSDVRTSDGGPGG